MPLETDRPYNLKRPSERVAYLEAALEKNDPAIFVEAIGDIAMAMSVNGFAELAGMNRHVVYKAFVKGGNPSVQTLFKALHAAGVRMTVRPSS